MIIVEFEGEKLVVPEPKDIPFLEATKKKILKDKKRAFKHLKRAYLKFRNLEGQPLKSCEVDFLNLVLKNDNTLDNKIKCVCAFGTIRGALITEMATNKNNLYNLNKGIAFYRSQKWL